MAASITENSTLAKRYASAFFEICKAASITEKTYEELTHFSRLLAENSGLADFISNPSNPKHKIVEIIGNLCSRENFSSQTKDFICFVILSRRGNIIPQITEKYLEILDKNSNTSRATVYSTNKLDNALVANISASLGKKTNSKVICENIIDNNLIGGLKIQVGSTLYDDSISEKLGRLKSVMQG